MTSTSGDDTRAKLLLAILKVGSVEAALARVLESDAIVSQEVPTEAKRLLSETRSASPETIAEFADRVRTEYGALLAEFASFAWLLRLSEEFQFSTYSRVEDSLSGILDSESYFWIGLRVLQANIQRKSGDLDSAAFYARNAVERTRRIDHAIQRKLMDAISSRATAVIAKEQGDFAKALILYKRSLKVSHDNHLRFAPMVAADLAELYWASGQFGPALELHRDETVRREGGDALGPAWLLRSHLSAAKCAIDAYETDIAGQELRAAEQLLRESSESSLPRMLEGYYRMYSGEWKVLTGLRDEGLLLLDSACEHFESMDPPFHSGLLDAKISIAQHAISRRDYRKLLTVIHKLLDESAEKGCIEARARLLVLESALFVSDNPPLGEAFQDLVTRLHLINNPALLMQALGNLFAYSLRYLDQPDQAFLMARLRNLQKVLDASCYQDLYEKYIEEQYGWAIENRLGDFLEEAPNPEDLEEA